MSALDSEPRLGPGIIHIHKVSLCQKQYKICCEKFSVDSTVLCRPGIHGVLAYFRLRAVTEKLSLDVDNLKPETIKEFNDKPQKYWTPKQK